MPTALIAPVIGVIALCVAIAGWDAAVFARRHFEQPRERLITWARECGEAFEQLLASDDTALKAQKEAPIPYTLRAYLSLDLLSDIDELENFSHPRQVVWKLHYVEDSIISQIKDAVDVAMRRWVALHGIKLDDQEPAQKMPSPGSVHDVIRGLRRVGNLQEQVLRYERLPWIRTVLLRPVILRRIRRRRKVRYEEWRTNLPEKARVDLVVPL
ncbi:Uncharacterised protein [Mycobacteroides abscessus subsp. bolletii]|uniref:hypothetical protein n=1 Tax=Mycobacteroides abscessus TaxID=36809 RepID=UPI00092C110C|nr:hypothetical protein [Mycobacteroides abscessus]SHY61586.1 Uncharacterised protein [Mycobacteroides abscessus subsp. bolletii]SHY73026.1 Uncharacterised protein [Mycobacteroides abscessus subsp. bolletii]